ncbi:MAG: hypothetical protein HOV87_09565 [Catenulispora sp.]|nr:hypothetical protein [Catenulispora sp.]
MSALYPTPSPTATAWLSRLRGTLATLDDLPDLADKVPATGTVDVETLAAQLKAEAPEASELPGETLEAALRQYEAAINGLTSAFGLRPATVVIALGRGQPLGELDPLVAAAMGQVAEINTLTSSGTVTIEKAGRSTTLIAATTVGPPVGPLRVPWPDRDDVWLCAVPAADPLRSAHEALARILPQTGVLRSAVRAAPAALHAALLTVDPAADPELVMARLEGWRTALEQLHRGAVTIHWEQA